ncbi:MAG: DUF6265 family protein [Thermoanaerobaculia bacterium]
MPSPVRRSRLLIVLALAAAGVARGEGPAPAAPDPAALAWMAGDWSATRDGITQREIWTAPDGGLLLGMHKEIRRGAAVWFEFLRIAVADGRLCLFASPGGETPTPFCAVEVAAERVVFENAAHDYPQRILYWRTANDELHARVEGAIRGSQTSEEWTWTRSGR